MKVLKVYKASDYLQNEARIKNSKLRKLSDCGKQTIWPLEYGWLSGPACLRTALNQSHWLSVTWVCYRFSCGCSKQCSFKEFHDVGSFKPKVSWIKPTGLNACHRFSDCVCADEIYLIVLLDCSSGSLDRSIRPFHSIVLLDHFTESPLDHPTRSMNSQDCGNSLSRFAGWIAGWIVQWFTRSKCEQFHCVCVNDLNA